jgi:hypothetical protein
MLWVSTKEPNLNYTADPVRMATLDVSGPVTITTAMGAERTYQPHDGAVYVAMSEDPVYVEGPVEDVSMGAPVSLSAPDTVGGDTIPVSVEADGNVDGEVTIDGHDGTVAPGSTADVRVTAGPEVRTVLADLVVDGESVGFLQASSAIDSDASAGTPDGGATDGGDDGAGDGGADDDGDTTPAGDTTDTAAPGVGVLGAALALLGTLLLARRR